MLKFSVNVSILTATTHQCIISVLLVVMLLHA